MADSLSSSAAMKYQKLWRDSLLILIIVAVLASKHGCNCTDSTTESNKNSDLTARTALVDIFQKYGTNGTLTFEAFEHLLYSLGLGNIAHMNHGVLDHRKNSTVHFEDIHPDHEHSEESNLEDETEEPFHRHDHAEERSDVQLGTTKRCMKPDELLGMANVSPRYNLTERDFLQLCPLLVLQLDMRICTKRHFHVGHGAHDDRDSNDTYSGYSHSVSVWGFSLLACIIISAVGLVAVAIIPIMHKVIYNHMLQFLVALSVGSLTGDALLHLLPHALIPHQEHHSNTDSNHGSHDRHTVWCGLTALGGIYLFFLVERLVGMCSERKRTRKEKRLQKLKECEASGGDASSALRMMNSSMQPVLAKDAVIPHGQVNHSGGNKLSRHADPATSCEEILMMVHTNKDVRKFADEAHDELHQHCDPAVKGNTWSHGGSSSNGGHNHSHSVSGSVASVAWMVIVGDGFHNFADGLAIGSAFASSLVGGLSTSVAVFCHELPHELGDFAMLLNAGMSAKQALVYNCVSSLLCLFGMVIGVLVGNVAAATTWIFALIAGLFLYIALVDMLPEMTRMDPKKGEHPLLHLALQNSGMLVGASIMLTIALFEDQLQDSLST